MNENTLKGGQDLMGTQTMLHEKCMRDVGAHISVKGIEGLPDVSRTTALCGYGSHVAGPGH